jgi:hypothetical protein
VNDLPAVVAHILATIRADLGDFDLTKDDAVKEGTFLKPPVGSGPFVCLTPPALVDSDEVGPGPLFYLETHTAQLRCWAPVRNASTDERARVGRKIASELVQRLDIAHRDPGTYPDNGIARCVRWRASQIDPTAAAATGLPGHGDAAINLEFTFRRAPGTGA